MLSYLLDPGNVPPSCASQLRESPQRPELEQLHLQGEAFWPWDLCQVLVSVEMRVKLGTVLLPGKAEMQLILGTERC